VAVRTWSLAEPLDDGKMNTYVSAPILALQTPAYCDLRQTTIQNIATGSTPAAMAWDTEISDDLGMHDNVTNTSRVTIVSAGGAGRYLAMGAVQWPANATGDRRAVIRKNGSVYRTGMRTMAVTIGGGTTVSLAWAIIPCIVGDYLELGAAQNSGGTLSTDNTSFSEFAWFQVIRVRD
jgi:hypothetical protein